VVNALALGVMHGAAECARPAPVIGRDARCAEVRTDKTGTLTVGEMTVRKIVTADRASP
jgi:cation transport ATPase